MAGEDEEHLDLGWGGVACVTEGQRDKTRNRGRKRSARRVYR